MPPRLSIGEFAAVSHLSVKTLRRYHEKGLLEPAEVDEWTGYRYYAAEQIGAAQAIRRLRELDLPEREIAELLADPDDATRRDLLAAHLRRLEDRLDRTRDAVAALRRLLHPVSLVVQRRSVAAEVVAGITGVVAPDELLDWYSAAMAELDAVLARPGHPLAGPPGALIEAAIFTGEPGRLTVHRPVAAPPSGGRVTAVTLPAAELITTVHPGSHADIDVTYGELARWALDRGRTVAGPVRETYLAGPRDTAAAADWRTEIALPIIHSGASS